MSFFCCTFAAVSGRFSDRRSPVLMLPSCLRPVASVRLRRPTCEFCSRIFVNKPNREKVK